MNQNMKAVLFDLDGTLCDTAPDLLVAVNRTRADLSLEPITREEMMVAVNDAGATFIKKCMPPEIGENPEKLQAAFDVYCSYYDSACCVKTTIFPGMLELIEELKKRSVKVAVYTNKPHHQAVTIVETLFPKDTFDVVLGFGRFPAKPDPTATAYLMELFGATKEETLYVGDSDTDMMTSENAGTYTVGVEWGYRPAEMLIEKGAKFIARGSGMSILSLLD